MVPTVLILSNGFYSCLDMATSCPDVSRVEEAHGERGGEGTMDEDRGSKRETEERAREQSQRKEGRRTAGEELSGEQLESAVGSVSGSFCRHGVTDAAPQSGARAADAHAESVERVRGREAGWWVAMEPSSTPKPLRISLVGGAEDLSWVVRGEEEEGVVGMGSKEIKGGEAGCRARSGSDCFHSSSPMSHHLFVS